MIEPIISQEEYNKLTGNNYSNNYDSKFLFMYNKLTKFRNDKK